MTHEFPLAFDRRFDDRRIGGERRAVDGEHAGKREIVEHLQEPPEADPIAVLVPSPVRDIGGRRAGRGREDPGRLAERRGQRAGLASAFATMVALHSGVGQVVDVTLLESLLQCMGPLPPAYGLTGFLQERQGSSLPYSVPRGTWRCGDGRWVAVSASAESVGRRVMELIGLGDREDLRSFAGRIAARAEIDDRMAEFCAARTVDEVVAAFDAAHAAAAPVYDMADVFADPQVAARGAIVEADGVPMQGLVARMSRTPGEVRWAGRPLGADDPPRWADPPDAPDPLA